LAFTLFVQEEELELESLKNVGLQKKDSAMGIHSKNPVHLSNTDVLRAPTTVSTSTSSPHPVGLEYVKKPGEPIPNEIKRFHFA
jgi:hypothetical protein